MHDPFNEVDSAETLPVHDVDPVQDFAPPSDSFTRGRLSQPEQANAETDITATVPVTAESLVSSTSIPPTISTSILKTVPSGKFFSMFVQVLHVRYRQLYWSMATQFFPLMFYWILLWIFYQMRPMRTYCVLHPVVR